MTCKECSKLITRPQKPGPKLLYCSVECRDKRNSRSDRAVFKAWLIPLKEKPCMDCGGKFPACCMEFHHRPGEKKKFCISGARTASIELRTAEIGKCDLVCANCHRIRHELSRAKHDS